MQHSKDLSTFGQVTNSPTCIILSSSGGSGSVKRRNQSFG